MKFKLPVTGRHIKKAIAERQARLDSGESSNHATCCPIYQAACELFPESKITAEGYKLVVDGKSFIPVDSDEYREFTRKFDNRQFADIRPTDIELSLPL